VEEWFADADSSFKQADFVIVGFPFDSEGKGGDRYIKEIRKESWNFESYNILNGIDLREVKIHDFGDVNDRNELKKLVGQIIDNGKFPIIFGGEHSITPFVVSPIHDKYENVGVISMDAHLDFRDEWMGRKDSCACVTRRLSEIVGAKKVAVVGVRSGCKKEMRDAKKMGLKYITSFDIKENGIDALRIFDSFDSFDPIYLTLDLDVVCPDVRYPEPFCISDIDLLKMIESFSPKLVGMDVVEVCGKNSARLAAKIVQECISWVFKSRRRDFQ
jgi:agmatinase